METEEAQIARGLRRRDPDLLDALIEQYQHRLLRYLLHLTGNRAVAEDLFQEVWLRVLEKGHLYDGRNRFVTWLMSIGAQRCHRLSAQAQSRHPRRNAGSRRRRAFRAAGHRAVAVRAGGGASAAGNVSRGAGARAAAVSRGAGAALPGADEAGGDCQVDPHSTGDGEDQNLSRRDGPAPLLKGGAQ